MQDVLTCNVKEHMVIHMGTVSGNEDTVRITESPQSHCRICSAPRVQNPEYSTEMPQCWRNSPGGVITVEESRFLRPIHDLDLSTAGLDQAYALCFSEDLKI